MEAVWNKGLARSLFNPLRKIYALHGEDDRQKDEALTLLRSAAVDPDFAEFDFEVVEAGARTVEDILSSAAIVPFASPARLVVIRGAEIFRKREKSAEAERLAAGLALLGASSCVALHVAAGEDERGRKTILTAKLDAVVKEHGIAIRCRALEHAELVDWIVEQAAAAGKGISNDAAVRLIQVGISSRDTIANELEKAICYSGESNRVTLADIDATCSYNPEDVMFKLVDAISRRDSDRSLRLLHELLRYDIKPQSVAGRLLALLSRQLKMVSQALELSAMRIDSGALRNLPKEVAAELPSDGSIVSMAWRARELYGASRQWDRRSLHAAFGMLLDCDMANKGGGSGSEDVVTNLELLILRLCGEKR